MEVTICKHRVLALAILGRAAMCFFSPRPLIRYNGANLIPAA
jgi:hypothetical protein